MINVPVLIELLEQGKFGVSDQGLCVFIQGQGMHLAIILEFPGCWVTLKDMNTFLPLKARQRDIWRLRRTAKRIAKENERYKAQRAHRQINNRLEVELQKEYDRLGRLINKNKS